MPSLSGMPGSSGTISRLFACEWCTHCPGQCPPGDPQQHPASSSHNFDSPKKRDGKGRKVQAVKSRKKTMLKCSLSFWPVQHLFGGLSQLSCMILDELPGLDDIGTRENQFLRHLFGHHVASHDGHLIGEDHRSSFSLVQNDHKLRIYRIHSRCSDKPKDHMWVLYIYNIYIYIILYILYIFII